MTPWLESVGLTKGTIYALTNLTRPPSTDVLTSLARTENASLRWLTESRGAPYRVTRVTEDAEGSLLLDELLEEPGWAGYQFTDQAGTRCLVLTQPGEFAIKKRQVPYTIVEILAGHIGPKTLKRFIQAASDGHNLYAAEISDEEFDRLSKGHMGNYELLGWRDEPGLIRTAVPSDVKAVGASIEKPSESQRPTTNSEKRLLKRFRELSPDAQQQLMKIVETFKN